MGDDGRFLPRPTVPSQSPCPFGWLSRNSLLQSRTTRLTQSEHCRDGLFVGQRSGAPPMSRALARQFLARMRLPASLQLVCSGESLQEQLLLTIRLSLARRRMRVAPIPLDRKEVRHIRAPTVQDMVAPVLTNGRAKTPR
ncbi:hypothetical protein ISCGN_001345 [Ixodes scapularis]